MISMVRVYAGEALFLAAKVCASAANKLGRAANAMHRIRTVTTVAATSGSRFVELNTAIPPGTRGVRLDLPDQAEVLRVVWAKDKRVQVHRPLAHDYPKGTPAEFLI